MWTPSPRVLQRSDLDVLQCDDVPGVDTAESISRHCCPCRRREESTGDGLKHGGSSERIKLPNGDILTRKLHDCVALKLQGHISSSPLLRKCGV